MEQSISIRRHNASEDGYMLLAAMFLLFLLALSLSIAAPMIAKSIQRDREVETMERGKQYSRAVQVYYRKFGSYPPNVEALVKTNNIRFLRKRYVDPMTGKDDWKPIMFGQAKAPMAMGFFGEPLAGGATAMAGIGPSGNNPTQNTGTGAPGTGIMGSSSLFGSSQTSPGPTSGGGTLGSGTPSATPTSGAIAPQAPAGTATGSPGGLGGQTFGGAGIVGFEPASPRQSILNYKKKNHYNEWEFTYSPISDMTKQSGNAGTIGQPASGFGGQSGPGTGLTGGGITGRGNSGGGIMGSGGLFGGSTSPGGTGSPPSTQPQTPPQQ